MKHCYLWLTLRLIKKQLLRTFSMFCGILFSGCLLYTFFGLGFYFWSQVHNPADPAAVYDSSQQILTALAAVLVAVVLICSAVFMNTLCTLAFDQKLGNLMRLMKLGASRNDLIWMAFLEICILSAVAIPSGWILASFILHGILNLNYTGIQPGTSMQINLCLLCWLFAMSCWFGLHPVICAFHRQKHMLPVKGRTTLPRHKQPDAKYPHWFTVFIVRKYHKADCRHHAKITAAVMAAVILYVPASYLIRTNLAISQDRLVQKFGIEYSYIASSQQELQDAIDEGRRIAQAASSAESILYAKITGEASVSAQLLSSSLVTGLEKAGWQGDYLHASSNIYFLEDSCYNTYVQSCPVLKTQLSTKQNFPPAILVNRYQNKTSYSEHTDAFFPETPLLNNAAEETINARSTIHAQQTEPASIKIYCGVSAGQTDARKYLYPAACCSELPEGISAGNITVILPLSQISSFYPSDGNFTGIEVCGLFADTDDALYDRLLPYLKSGSGQLVNIRQNYQHWYNSLHDIHLAMRCICGLLFLTALFHISGTMLVHCMQRRHGFTILWSLGGTRQELAIILAFEALYSFIRAVAAGIPVSCLLCYYIYRIYMPIWQIDFSLPVGQLLLIITVAALATAAAAAASLYIINRQDFLKELRTIL